MSEVLVTVIIPVYNTAKWLPDCLDSVLRQTYGGLEVLCIDDCSTDPRCRRIIESHQEKPEKERFIPPMKLR